MTWFFLTILFIIVSVAMVLIILVQRAQGGGLAGAFGGAGGGSTDTVFGGRVGDALTWATVIAFVLYLLFAVWLNKIDLRPTPPETVNVGGITAGPEDAPVDPNAPAAPATETVPAETPADGGAAAAPATDAGGEADGE